MPQQLTAPSHTAQDEDLQQPTTSQLQSSLSQAQIRINSLEKTYEDQRRLQSLYEDTLADATDRIRQYCFEQQNHIRSLHEHYTGLLQQSRYETIEAQLTHQAWQAGLKRVSEGVREAVKAREEEGRPWKGRIAGLKEENRVLRKMVGWDPPVDSDEEEDGEENGEEVRGRMSQVSHAVGGGGGQEMVP